MSAGERLSAEREAEIRAALRTGRRRVSYVFIGRDLLRELDAVRAERDIAEKTLVKLADLAVLRCGHSIADFRIVLPNGSACFACMSEMASSQSARGNPAETGVVSTHDDTPDAGEAARSSHL